MAGMVDIGGKAATDRKATASARIRMRPQTLQAILDGQVRKGNVTDTARLAGIIGAKQCPQLLPLCHPLPLDGVQVDLEPEDDRSGLLVRASCSTRAATGVEMEALTACASAALCVYDMCKSLDPAMEITDLHLEEKSGGKSGHWQRESD